MTYIYPCGRKSCIENVEGGKMFIHWKSNCCNMCPNTVCKDHGECKCLEELATQLLEQIKTPEWFDNVLPKIQDKIEEFGDNSDGDT